MFLFKFLLIGFDDFGAAAAAGAATWTLSLIWNVITQFISEISLYFGVLTEKTKAFDTQIKLIFFFFSSHFSLRSLRLKSDFCFLARSFVHRISDLVFGLFVCVENFQFVAKSMVPLLVFSIISSINIETINLVMFDEHNERRKNRFCYRLKMFGPNEIPY